VLGNLAQTLMLSGHLEDAQRMWQLLLNGRPPLHIVLPALGGFAISSAQLHDRNGVEWAAQQVRTFAKHRHHSREIAAALLECALGLEYVGLAPQGGVLRRRAEAIAVAFGYHDLTFAELPGILPAAARQRFTGAAARAKTEIESLAVPELPVDVQLAAV
jgi:hypothetical protein